MGQPRSLIGLRRHKLRGGVERGRHSWRPLSLKPFVVSLYVANYNFCRIREALRSTPAMALGIADRVWTIGDLLDAALATQPIDPVVTAPDRRKRFTVVKGGKI